VAKAQAEAQARAQARAQDRWRRSLALAAGASARSWPRRTCRPAAELASYATAEPCAVTAADRGADGSAHVQSLRLVKCLLSDEIYGAVNAESN